MDYTYENTFDYEKRGDDIYAVTKTQKLKINNIKNVHFNLENMLGEEKLGKQCYTLKYRHRELIRVLVDDPVIHSFL